MESDSEGMALGCPSSRNIFQHTKVWEQISYATSQSMPNTAKAGYFNDVALIFLLVPHPMNNTVSIEK